MSNAYEPPKTDTNDVSNLFAPRPSALLTLLFGIGGAFVGYVAINILGNIYTIQTADLLVQLILFVGFIIGGAYAGFRMARDTYAEFPITKRQDTVKLVNLSLTFGVMGWVAAMVMLTTLSTMREGGGYDYYLNQPVGGFVVLGGAAVGLATPWVAQRLTRNRSS